MHARAPPLPAAAAPLRAQRGSCRRHRRPASAAAAARGAARSPPPPPPPRGVASNAARIDSAKTGALAAVAGSFASAPVAWFLPALAPALSMPPPLSAAWELDTDGLAASLALFGLVYRYASRDDGTPLLKQGVVGAFLALRVIAQVHPSPGCTPVPLVCGPPLIYADWGMLAQAAASAAPAAAGFLAAAAAIEVACAAGWLTRATNGGADL
jgi:hypothetical protein